MIQVWDAESLEGLRLIFQGVMARWANDPAKFIEIADQLGEGDWTMSALFLKGELDAAVGYIGETKDDPFIFLTLYSLTLVNGESEKSEEHLTVALKALEADSHWRHVMVPWFQPDAAAPSMQDTLKVSLPNADRRVLLVALGLRHPSLRQACFDLAGKLNHDRTFPYLTLQRILQP